MRLRSLVTLLAALFGSTSLLPAQTNKLVIFPDEDALTTETLKLVWPTTPGLRYEVKQSTNLQIWSTAPGFPAPAAGPAQQMPFITDGKARFFRVHQLDEQPPAILSQYPQDGGFAVPRFSNLTLELSDVSGIATNSLRLTVGYLGTFWLTNSQLTFSNNILTFINGGSIPLGNWGTNIQATLVVADSLGNTGTNSWSFTLETQPQVVTNLFVFGSPQAQRTGQQIGNIPTRVLAQRFGPVPMDAGDPWTLELVASNRLEISYTNIAPGFALNQYICNLTPARPEDIFNRKITSISNAPADKLLTLYTIEVPLTEIATNGAVSITGNSMVLQTGTNGNFAKAFEIGGTVTFPRIGYSLDGTEFKLKNAGDFDIVNLTLEEEHWWLTPRLQVGLEVHWGELKRFEAIASGHIDSASVWDVDFLLAGVALETTFFDLPEPLEPKSWMFLGSIGPVPVYASLGLDVKVKGRAEVNATVNFHAGKRETADASFGVTYNKPDVQWVHTFNFPPPEVIPFTANINAEGSVRVSFEPALEFLVYGLAGISAGITPSAAVVFETGTGQPLSGRLEADVTFDLGLAGPAFELFDPTPELSLSLWHDEWHLFPNASAIAFKQQPQSQTVPVGGSAYFFCTVATPETPAYQWHFNGVPMPGQTARTLSIPSVSSGHSGNYQVRVTAGGQTSNSVPATLTVVSPLLQSGLVAWYPFDGDWKDHSGHPGADLANYGVTFLPGISGQAASFDGNSTYFAAEDSPLFHFGTSDLTIAAWIKSSSATGVRAFVSKEASGGGMQPFPSFQFRLVDGEAQFFVTDEGHTFDSVFSPTTLADGQFHHLVGVRNASGYTLYVDGLFANFTADSPHSPDNDVRMLIGAQNETGPGSPAGVFEGCIDDVRIYNRVLSALEVQQLYNSISLAAPVGMSVIPAGSFQMGDTLNEGGADELPVHAIYLNSFYIDQYEVTKGLWDSVYQWAISHGYSFDHSGSGGFYYPVNSISWYDAVKWCNARSEKEGKTPVYYIDSGMTQVYQTGQIAPFANWNAAGYRLPTEAEWEKAARGMLPGKRYPNSDFISHSDANYSLDPIYGDGPSPVGMFQPNGHGLHDMAGNVWEFCWDWYAADYYSSSPTFEPHGPAIGLSRTSRGGSYHYNQTYCRVANRDAPAPDQWDGNYGFRCVMKAGQ